MGILDTELGQQVYDSANDIAQMAGDTLLRIGDLNGNLKKLANQVTSTASGSDLIEAKRRIVLSTKWDYNSNFWLKLKAPDGKTIPLGSDNKQSEIIINTCVTSVSIGAKNYQAIEEWISGKWNITTAIPQVQQITVTFRDFNKGNIYSYFKWYFNALEYAYPQEQEWDIGIIKTGSVYNSPDVFNNTLTLFNGKCVLMQISEYTLNQTNDNQILEFSITFSFANNPYDKTLNI